MITPGESTHRQGQGRLLGDADDGSEQCANAGPAAYSLFEAQAAGDHFPERGDRSCVCCERAIEYRLAKSIGGLAAVLAAEVVQVPDLLNRINKRDALDDSRPGFARRE